MSHRLKTYEYTPNGRLSRRTWARGATYAYDHRGRMVRKGISRGVGGLLAVIRSNSSTPNSSTHQLYLPAYDANGNVSEYVATNGNVAAHYEYSAFGEPVVTSGELAASFTHQFSTKPYCATTGFNEYQMRKYRPDVGRWMSRDPVGKEGGINLYGFSRNTAVIAIDILGKKFQLNGCDCNEHSWVDRPCRSDAKNCIDGGYCTTIDSGESKDFRVPWRMCVCVIDMPTEVIRKRHGFCGEKRMCLDIVRRIVHPNGETETIVLKQRWKDCQPL